MGDHWSTIKMKSLEWSVGEWTLNTALTIQEFLPGYRKPWIGCMKILKIPLFVTTDPRSLEEHKSPPKTFSCHMILKCLNNNHASAFLGIKILTLLSFYLK